MSYFLRENKVISDEMSSSTSSSSTSSSEDFISPILPVYIRNGCLIDNYGMIAHAILCTSQIQLPLSTVALRCVFSDVPPRLILSALNASLVAVTNYNSQQMIVNTKSVNQYSENKYPFLSSLRYFCTESQKITG